MADIARREELALQHVNTELAELLDVAALPMEHGGGRALADTLWVWGIVGGKDVGKSTLINALAGGDVVDRGVDYGEGTFAPSAYLTSRDRPALTARFAGLEELDIRYVDAAPDTMRGLVLVDLPDFDSLFTDHLAAVRRIAGVLDGIIWVTTPKKVGDVRAIDEVERILKARANFAYVVNKMDWLIAQSNQPPQVELARAAEALRRQVSCCDADDGRARSFLVSARYRTHDDMLAAIARSRAVDAARLNGEMAQAVDELLGRFTALRERLTTAPTSDVAEANKQANLTFQLRTQAERLRQHYQPEALLARLERALDEETLNDLAARYFSPEYCAAVLRRLNGADMLFATWSASLFRRRVARWPLLGAVASPLMAIGAALAGMRALLPRLGSPEAPDPFRQDGVGIRERADGLVAAIRARLAGLSPRAAADLPDADEIARTFAADARGLAETQRETIAATHMQRRAGAFGRMVRGAITLSVLLWFPLVQPLLAAWLATAGADGVNVTESLKLLVHTLSGGAVLSGLCVSLLLLAALTGAVYSRAVADTYRALDRLRTLADEGGTDTLNSGLLAAITQAPRALRSRLAEIIERLEALADTSGGG
ncbi:MAG TPA: GTPase domain-containing protein [Phycisphaerae bacterium]|nr:GTPase domain-containing protein [Phycisphaerales bacterium]HRX86899.1 GTPase domain-containing protein [Phycisphaerae bacterium]